MPIPTYSPLQSEMMLAVLAAGREEVAFNDLAKLWSWKVRDHCEKKLQLVRGSSTRCRQTAHQAGQPESQPTIISLNFCHKTACQGIPSEHGSENAAQKEKETSQDPAVISGNQSASVCHRHALGHKSLLKRRKGDGDRAVGRLPSLPRGLTGAEMEPEAESGWSSLTRRLWQGGSRSLRDVSVCFAYKREATNSLSFPRRHTKSTQLFHLVFSWHIFNQLYTSNLYS